MSQSNVTSEMAHYKTNQWEDETDETNSYIDVDGNLFALLAGFVSGRVVFDARRQIIEQCNFELQLQRTLAYDPHKISHLQHRVCY